MDGEWKRVGKKRWGELMRGKRGVGGAEEERKRPRRSDGGW